MNKDIQEVIEIIKKYNTGKLCTCTDESGAGGFWDLAKEYAERNHAGWQEDIWIMVHSYYDGLKAGSMIREHDDDEQYCGVDVIG